MSDLQCPARLIWLGTPEGSPVTHMHDSDAVGRWADLLRGENVARVWSSPGGNERVAAAGLADRLGVVADLLEIGDASSDRGDESAVSDEDRVARLVADVTAGLVEVADLFRGEAVVLVTPAHLLRMVAGDRVLDRSARDARAYADIDADGMRWHPRA